MDRTLQLDNPYTQKDRRTGARRLALHDKPVFEKNLTSRTHFWKVEVEQQVYLSMVDANAQLPNSGWHAKLPPPAIVRPFLCDPEVGESDGTEADAVAAPAVAAADHVVTTTAPPADVCR